MKRVALRDLNMTHIEFLVIMVICRHYRGRRRRGVRLIFLPHFLLFFFKNNKSIFPGFTYQRLWEEWKHVIVLIGFGFFFVWPIVLGKCWKDQLPNKIFFGQKKVLFGLYFFRFFVKKLLQQFNIYEIKI